LKVLDKADLMIVLLLGAFFTVGITLAAAYAQEDPRQVINNKENQLEAANDRILELNKLLETQRDLINEKDNLINTAKENLREIKKVSLESWDNLLELRNSENKLNESLNNLRESKDKLSVYLSEKSGLISLIKTLEKELNIDKSNLAGSTPKESKIKLLGVEISRSCDMIESCLKYSDLISLDTSNQIISGQFVDNKRQPSPYVKSWRFYDLDNSTRLFVDPPLGMVDKIPMITITNHLPIYFKSGDLTINNNTRTYSEGRYIDNCQNALITSDMDLLLDTIEFMRGGCVGELQEDKVEILPQTQIDITTSPNWQAEQKLKENIAKCRGLCFEY